MREVEGRNHINSPVRESEPIHIDLLRINKGRKKLCQCNPPYYEVDLENRIVMCTDCGAVVDPFDALLSVCQNYEIYQEDIRRLKEKAKTYADEAKKEFDRMCRNRTFREMEHNYRLNMLPTCPECGNIFDPVNITLWTNRKVLEVYGKEREHE